MAIYNFTIRLLGTIEAESSKEADEIINRHLDELGAIIPEDNIQWPNCEYDLEEEK